eukprot:gene24673-10303_t
MQQGEAQGSKKYKRQSSDLGGILTAAMKHAGRTSTAQPASAAQPGTGVDAQEAKPKEGITTEGATADEAGPGAEAGGTEGRAEGDGPSSTGGEGTEDVGSVGGAAIPSTSGQEYGQAVLDTATEQGQVEEEEEEHFSEVFSFTMCNPPFFGSLGWGTVY